MKASVVMGKGVDGEWMAYAGTVEASGLDLAVGWIEIIGAVLEMDREDFAYFEEFEGVAAAAVVAEKGAEMEYMQLEIQGVVERVLKRRAVSEG
jgi:hypothetical protein